MVEEKEEESFFLPLKIGFRQNGELPVSFDSMAFGYAIYDGNDKIRENRNPLGNINYVSTEEDYIYSTVIDGLVPGKKYTMSVWFQNNEKISEEDFEFSLPLPEKPYPSWIYNNELNQWESPVPYPQEKGLGYIWDEDNAKWTPNES